MSMAVVMSTMPDVWRKALAEHVPDQGQRCRSCRNASGETASWPCQTYRVAQEAKWVAEGNLPGTGPHGSVSPRATREAPPSAPSRDSWDRPRESSWDALPSSGSLDRDPLERSPGLGAGSSFGGSPERDPFDRDPRDPFDRDPLGGRSLGGPYDPPPESGPVPGLGQGGGRHAGGDAAPYGSRMDAPYGASFGVDDGPRH